MQLTELKTFVLTSTKTGFCTAEEMSAAIVRPALLIASPSVLPIRNEPLGYPVVVPEAVNVAIFPVDVFVHDISGAVPDAAILVANIPNAPIFRLAMAPVYGTKSVPAESSVVSNLFSASAPFFMYNPSALAPKPMNVVPESVKAATSTILS